MSDTADPARWPDPDTVPAVLRGRYVPPDTLVLTCTTHPPVLQAAPVGELARQLRAGLETAAQTCVQTLGALLGHGGLTDGEWGTALTAVAAARRMFTRCGPGGEPAAAVAALLERADLPGRLLAALPWLDGGLDQAPAVLAHPGLGDPDTAARVLAGYARRLHQAGPDLQTELEPWLARHSAAAAVAVGLGGEVDDARTLALIVAGCTGPAAAAG